MSFINNTENTEEIWKALISKFSDSSTAKIHWKELLHFYTNSNRHYHNLNHISYMLNLAEKFKDKISDFETLLFCIYYHDAIYNVKRKDNELKSAELADERLRSINYPEEKIKRCFDQIMATASHQTQIDNDTNYLLDFDLGVLGDSEDKYAEYAKNIRREYAMYPDLLYNPARKKVLLHFLKMPQIYKTPEFLDERESQARLNLEIELKLL